VLWNVFRLSRFSDKEFDAAITPMMLQPKNLSGYTTFPVESMAGPSHFKGFLSFYNNGGLPGLLESFKLLIEYSTRNSVGTIQIVKLMVNAPPSNEHN